MKRALVLALLVLLSSPLCAQKLRVYVLAGQSNMQGHARISTFDYIGDDPKTAPLLKKMRARDGSPIVVDRARISYLTHGNQDGNGVVEGPLTAGFGARRNASRDDGKIGPEFTFGITMAEADRSPVLIIKTAWGGKSLHTDFRPPSAGPFPFTKKQLADLEKRGQDLSKVRAEKEAATGHYYRLMVAHVKDVLARLPEVYPGYKKRYGYELAGFVWFQGWNDMVDRGVYPQRDRPGGYEAYSDCLAHFIRDVRKDLDAPKMPFVIGVMGVGGPVEKKDEKRRAVHRNFRDAMTEPSKRRAFRKNVVAVPTDPYWDQRLAAIDEKRGQIRNLSRRLRNEHKDTPNADGSMSPAEQREYVERFAKDLMGEDEKIWARGASNAGYHYLGSAKTMAQIGEAFAKALLRM